MSLSLSLSWHFVDLPPDLKVLLAEVLVSSRSFLHGRP